MFGELDFATFSSNFERWFDTSDIDDDKMQQLWRAWLDFRADEKRFKGLIGSMFAFENTRVRHGLAWWESRQQGSPKTVHPITTLDVVNMFVTSSAPRDIRVRPKAYRPDEFVGHWVLRGVSPDRGEPHEPAEERTVTLEAGGQVITTGHPDLTGYTWRVHLARSPQLWLQPAVRLFPEKLVVLTRGSPMDLRRSGQIHGYERWERVANE